MSRNLDIAPLRSLVAVADFGGFQRAATALHLTQSAVSQHVRRLESVVGAPLVERHGRGSRFTTDGELLLTQARRIIMLHDETVARFLPGGSDGDPRTISIGSTEHAAAQLLPDLSTALAQSVPKRDFRFRIDRGNKLRDGLASGSIDLALILQQADDAKALYVGDLTLAWFASPAWRRPAPSAPVPVVAFDEPCALRSRALDTLAEHSIPAAIGAEAFQLAGVQAAVGAGLGVALMATLGEVPDGLTPVTDLPPPDPLPLYVCARPGLPKETATQVASVLRPLLTTPRNDTVLTLAKGA
ncbi:LysR family transcriptional regulator [Nocardioides sp. NPDC059952]|uniref:LysR family transcriptional regulator n=1 Tax=Nocardioides sp. NPDC059952 TaxID=3347014 RepID=UPI0036689FCA